MNIVSHHRPAMLSTRHQPRTQSATVQPEKVTLSDSSEIDPSLFSKAGERFKEVGVPLLGGAAMFAGMGAAIGSIAGAPAAGALKGLGLFGFLAAASELMDNRKVESAVFNWSKTMPGDDATPRDLPDTRKNDLLFKANLATNVAVLSGIGAAGGAILGGTPGAIIGGGLVLVGGAFAEVLTA
jgi:hypothetical protein